MKTRTTTHALWLPSLGINDNMLQHTGSTRNHHIYLHSVSLRRIDRELTALMEVEFYKVKADLGRETSFGDYRPLTRLESEAVFLQINLKKFMEVAQAEEIEGPSHKFCFTVPLLESKFVDRAISVAKMLKEQVGSRNSPWLIGLEVIQTTGVYFKKVWVPIGQYRLYSAGEISEEDMLRRAV